MGTCDLPAVSVIIPTLNEAEELPLTLAAARRALGAEVEIIVVDGGSLDGTTEEIDPATRLLSSSAGRGRQLNTGAQAATGEVLLFLHADTHLHPEAGPALARALAKPEVVGGCFELSLRGPSAGRRLARLLARAINLRSRLFSTATGDQAIFVRRAVFQRLGGYSNVDLFEDVILYRRIQQLGQAVLIGPPVSTSDRRWRRLGYARTIATHLALRLLFHLRMSPARLARIYRRVS